MKTLRLICTYKCDRNCEGCCNKQDNFTPDNVPDFNLSYYDYDEIIMTGGEPMLFPDGIRGLASIAMCQNPEARMILYTAKTTPIDEFEHMLRYFDGITLTIHDQADVDDFLRLHFHLKRIQRWIQDNNKSMRLNIFKGVNVVLQRGHFWHIKDNIEWIPDCPLPSNESIAKLKYLF